MGRWPDAADRPGSPENVVAEDDETLPSGVAPWWLLQTRRQRRLAAPVLVLVAGLAVAAIVETGGTGHRAHPRPVPSAVAASLPDPNLPAQCVYAISCIAADAVPRSTSAAISASLAGAHEGMTYTVTQRGTDRLIYRVVNATAADIELLVIVKLAPLARPAATSTADPSPGAAIRYVRRQEGQYEVQIQYTGPPGRTPPVAQAVRLALDARLLEVE